jgi:hypothetical protein
VIASFGIESFRVTELRELAGIFPIVKLTSRGESIALRPVFSLLLWSFSYW